MTESDVPSAPLARLHRIPMRAVVAATGETVPVEVVLVMADQLDAYEAAIHDAADVAAMVADLDEWVENLDERTEIQAEASALWRRISDVARSIEEGTVDV